jgi:uncharacterized protein (DUF488 family)
VEIYSIGFTQKTAEQFFGILKHAGIRRLVDVRLNNVSQLAAFAKRDDLRYFLREICGAEYVHEPLLAPTQELLDGLKKNKGPWAEYEAGFLSLMRERRVEEQLAPPLLLEMPTALLCSEPTAECCHRRLVLEYLRERWCADFEIVHL